jgi:hypothetical protein
MAMVKQDGMCQSFTGRSGELSRPAVGAIFVRSGREQADIPQAAPRVSGRFFIRLSVCNSETSSEMSDYVLGPFLC